MNLAAQGKPDLVFYREDSLNPKAPLFYTSDVYLPIIITQHMSRRTRKTLWSGKCRSDQPGQSAKPA